MSMSKRELGVVARFSCAVCGYQLEGLPPPGRPAVCPNCWSPFAGLTLRLGSEGAVSLRVTIEARGAAADALLRSWLLVVRA